MWTCPPSRSSDPLTWTGRQARRPPCGARGFTLTGQQKRGIVTSVVRYEAGSEFPTHHHPGGEEIFVLDGVFSDEHGDYPAGTYLLNPDGTSHAPFSKDGCTLFVKLREHGGEGRTQVEMNSGALDWQPRNDSGVWQKPLYRQGSYREWTQLLKLDPGRNRHLISIHERRRGVRDRRCNRGRIRCLPRRHRIRYPPGSSHTIKSPKGAILYVRLGGIAGQ